MSLSAFQSCGSLSNVSASSMALSHVSEDSKMILQSRLRHGWFHSHENCTYQDLEGVCRGLKLNTSARDISEGKSFFLAYLLMIFLTCAAILLLYCVLAIRFPFYVIWDLDHTLIFSHALNGDRIRKGPKVQEKVLQRNRSSMSHMDDDGLYFETKVRPWTTMVMAILYVLQVQQLVFTSASRGYMNNVCLLLDPWGIFFKKKLCQDDQMDMSRGKDITLFPGVTHANGYLVDDNPKYLGTTPGFLIPPYGGQDHDHQLLLLLLRILPHLLERFFRKAE